MRTPATLTPPLPNLVVPARPKGTLRPRPPTPLPGPPVPAVAASAPVAASRPPAAMAVRPSHPAATGVTAGAAPAAKDRSFQF